MSWVRTPGKGASNIVVFLDFADAEVTHSWFVRGVVNLVDSSTGTGTRRGGHGAARVPGTLRVARRQPCRAHFGVLFPSVESM